MTNPNDRPTHAALPTLPQMRDMLKLANDLHLIRSAPRRVEHLLSGLLHLLGAEWATCAALISADPPVFGRVAHLARGPLERSTGRPIDLATDPGVATVLDHPPQTNSPVVRHRKPPPAPGRVSTNACSLYSLCRNIEGRYGLSLVVVRRAHAFEEREMMILRLLHPQTEWAIHRPGMRITRALPRRASAVLDLLLEGHSEKEVARRISRSTHTVHTHIKRVYRHYGVSSRAELLACFVN